MNKQPFYIGQKVVCVDDSTYLSNATTVKDLGLKKGDIYTVRGVLKGCCYWLIDIGICKEANHTICRICYTPRYMGGNAFFSASRFAPIEPRHVEIDAAIIEQAEGMVAVKETVLEQVLN